MLSETLKMTVGNHKIEKSSENIVVMIFKLATSNVRQILVRHKEAHLQPTGVACHGTIFVYEIPAKFEIHQVKSMQ